MSGRDVVFLSSERTQNELFCLDQFASAPVTLSRGANTGTWPLSGCRSSMYVESMIHPRTTLAAHVGMAIKMVSMSS